MTDKAIEAATKVMCRSGKFETGHGTCALTCMGQLGDPRKRGCQNTLTVFGNLMRAAIAAYEQAMWRPIEEAPKDGTLFLVWCPSYAGLPSMFSLCAWHPDAGFCVDELRQPTHYRPLPPSPGKEIIDERT